MWAVAGKGRSRKVIIMKKEPSYDIETSYLMRQKCARISNYRLTDILFPRVLVE